MQRADVASCPSCVMSVATRVFHMSFADSALHKKMFVKCRTVCTNIRWHQVSHTMTHRKTLFSVWIKCNLRGSPLVQVPSTPQILSQTCYLDPACSSMDTSHAVSSLPSSHCSLPAAAHSKSCHSLSRWLSTPKGHPWLSSCHSVDTDLKSITPSWVFYVFPQHFITQTASSPS